MVFGLRIWRCSYSYMIMKMCWNLEPTERPTFNKISQMIERILGDQDEKEKVRWFEITSQIRKQNT